MRAYEDTIELEIEILESGPPTPSSYPFPSLSLTGRRERLTFRSLVLENDMLKVLFTPDLGGRILSVVDRQSGKELVAQLEFINGGPRGVLVPQGVQIQILGERLNSLGPVEAVISEDEVHMFELCAGKGLSWQARWRLDEESPRLYVEVRIQNRTLDTVAYNAGVGSSQRFSADGELAPRQGDVWETEVLLPAQPHMESDAGHFPTPGSETHRPLPATQTFAERGIPHPRFGDSPTPPRDTNIRGEGWGTTQAFEPYIWQSSARPLFEENVQNLRRRHEIATWDSASVDPASRPAAWIAKGYEACRERDFEGAVECFESALLFNAEDPLTWLIKAIAKRHAGGIEEDNPDLLNAHFLSPLEPALRAESFLSSETRGKDPSPLVAPLADNPEAMIEIASMLLEAGLDEDLFRWVDECLRHREIPSLRYLLAYAYPNSMAFEAASQIGAAAKAPINPPYPWRPIEIIALTELNKTFPKDERIPELLKLMELGGTK